MKNNLNETRLGAKYKSKTGSYFDNFTVEILAQFTDYKGRKMIAYLDEMRIDLNKMDIETFFDLFEELLPEETLPFKTESRQYCGKCDYKFKEGDFLMDHICKTEKLVLPQEVIEAMEKLREFYKKDVSFYDFYDKISVMSDIYERTEALLNALDNISKKPLANSTIQEKPVTCLSEQASSSETNKQAASWMVTTKMSAAFGSQRAR